MSYMTKQMTKKKKPNRQLEWDLKVGKKSYRLRIKDEQEVKKEIIEYANKKV